MTKKEYKINEYFRLPKVVDLKKLKKPIRFRFLKGYTIDIIFKHQGERDLYKPEQFYDQFGKPGSSKITAEEALQRHPLKYTTACGDQDADNSLDAKEECIWCAKYIDGIKTLRRKKYLVGYIVTEENVPKILYLPKPTLGEDIASLKMKEKYDKWVKLYPGKVTVAGNEIEIVRAKYDVTIKDLKERDEELAREYELTPEDININNNALFVKYFSPDKNYRSDEKLDNVD